VATDRFDLLRVFRSPLSRGLFFALLFTALGGCAGISDHYLRAEQSLRNGDPDGADQIIASAESKYGSKSRLLYEMDRGMTLHLAGKYDPSNAMLEQADQEVDALYTKRIRTEAKAFLINDTELPYDGDPYEQVMINVIKALNYAVVGNWTDALVEARRIDNRLNVLADRAGAKNGYRDDGFARYLTGVLYEATDDINNAFIAYRNAQETYRRASPWSKTPVPLSLQADLLRTTDALHFSEEHQEYLRLFPDVTWKPVAETKNLAQLVVISYNGRAPYKKDMFIDLPLSMNALNLVLLSQRANRNDQTQNARAVESALYGLNGHVVRVALPKLVPQKTQIAFSEVGVTGEGGSFSARTELVNNLSATAEKTLADRFTAVSVKAVARAALKYALAEGASLGARQAMGNRNEAGPLVGLLVGFLGKAWAIYTEEADKRSWRTLPDEIQMARLWVRPGIYEVKIRPVGRGGGTVGRESLQPVILRAGETSIVTQRALP
jgi:hypothetical protein